MDKNTNNYDIPKRDGSVWPEDICPAYTPREDAIPSLKGCWYCKYADFHLKEERALEVGICKWPNKIIDQYPDPKNEITYAYAITRTEWEKEKGLNNDQE